LPSPQTGEQVSSAPMSPKEFSLVHAQPSSTAQREEQPSPPSVLLSSHASAVERSPLPQTCTTGTKSSSVSSVVLLVSTTTSVVSSSKGEVPSASLLTESESDEKRRRRNA